MNLEYESKIKERFPNLEYGRLQLLDNRQERLGIDDLTFRNPRLGSILSELIDLFRKACNGEIYFWKAEELSILLSNQLESLLNKISSDRTLLIFPGNGAQAVKSLLPRAITTSFPILELDTRRRLSTDMLVEGVDILTGVNPKPQTDIYVLIDDVVASGSTAAAVKAYFEQNPDQKWYAASWMSLSPLQSKNRKRPDEYGSSLIGFQRVITPLLYQGISGIPANNSLSSFAETGDKSETIINRYKQKYVANPAWFDKVILQLRRIRYGSG